MSTDAVPLPRDMYERFKAYPSCIERLQRAIDGAVADSCSIPVFERINERLEDALDALVHHARIELEDAEKLGDADRIAEARERVRFMLDASSIWSYDLSDLQARFGVRAGNAS